MYSCSFVVAAAIIILLNSVVLHLFVRLYVAMLKAKFAENVHVVLPSLD